MSDNDDFAIGPDLLCGGCAAEGVCRLGVKIADEHDGATRFDVVCPRHWQGGPAVAHGGWTAAMFDDVLNVAALRSEPRLVTKSLSVQYLRPVPVERPLTALARVERHEGREWTVSARLTLGPHTLATARAELRTRRPDHYARAERQLPFPVNEN
ncbi:PaaI family thioesterase [Amycolatopsis sp.]|uniref:PaaI family thioesterase n=1 Tax=Amycolatopsis sp. TaxID=37632 RepID=UPI002C6688BD|nr:PaaI family thioesterase [Amycolatopsis sp.]HVV14503.1 PaaI family thioesterase [Amycolatopsis sp.]